MATVTAGKETTHTSSKSSGTDREPAAPIVLDLGKHRRKAVRRLRKGDGKLMDEIVASIEELRSAGAVAEGAQTVIVVVRQKRRKRSLGFLPGF
jgi:hypothetical protein